LNFADIACVLGLYKAAPSGPFIPGLEYAGIVISKGRDVTGFMEGDAVMGLTRFGGYSDHINIPFHYLTKLPDGWSFEEGAAFLVQSLTAYYALIRLANIDQGQTILIQSAAGGVGIMANRIAKRFNAYTIGSVSHPSKRDLLIREGYDKVIVRTENFRNDLRNLLGDRSLNIVLESIGGQVFRDSFRILAPEGKMVVFGSASFITHGNRPDYWKLIRKYWKRPMIDPMKLAQWNKSVMGFNLIYLYEQRDHLKNYLAHLKKLNIGKPYIGHVYPFHDLLTAVKLLQSGITMGKVIINMG
jgi:alcohol dehydrogenase